MSLDLLYLTRDLLQAHDPDLTDGYQMGYYRLTPRLTQSDQPFILIRKSGGGVSDPISQQFDIDIMVAGFDSTVDEADNRAAAIEKMLRSELTVPGIIRAEPVGTSTMFRLEDERPVFRVVARLFVEGH